MEYLGFIGMAFVMGSFLTKNIKLLRILNMAGSVLFLAHGLIIQDPSTMLTNGALLTINTIRLVG
jgi:hypothetical protein